MALAFSMRSTSSLASSSLQRWQQTYHTHRNAQLFAEHYHSAQLSFKMLLIWRLHLRKKLKMGKQAKIAEQFFTMRGAWRTWLTKLAEKKRERKLKEFEKKTVERYFEGEQNPGFVNRSLIDWAPRVEDTCASSAGTEVGGANYPTKDSDAHHVDCLEPLDQLRR